MKKVITFLVILTFAIPVNAQRGLEKTLGGYVNPEELVSLSEDIPFDKALEVLSKMSEKLTGKKIVSTAGVSAPIGINIDKMPYVKALLIIVQYKNLEFEERESVIVVRKKQDPTRGLAEDIYAPLSEREVKISALFFEANITEMRERGINWKWLLSQDGFDIGTDLLTTPESKAAAAGEESGSEAQLFDYTIGTSGDFEVGRFKGNVVALFRFFEDENLGEVIARPSISVRNRNTGLIQIGSDLSIKTRDFAGNIIDNFVSTGTIVNVTPYMYTEEGIDYVLLKLTVERSSGTPGLVSTEIRLTKASTQVLMLDGEETIIGGLFINEEINVRRGIPFLKDLPWWVLGIRYLTGYEQKQITKKEIIILIRTDIVPTLKERIANKKEQNLIKERLRENQDAVKQYKIDHFKKENEDDK